MKHYSLEDMLNCLSFTCVSVFPLQQVILAADSEDVFQWTQKQRFETGMTPSKNCNSSNSSSLHQFRVSS